MKTVDYITKKINSMSKEEKEDFIQAMDMVADFGLDTVSEKDLKLYQALIKEE